MRVSEFIKLTPSEIVEYLKKIGFSWSTTSSGKTAVSALSLLPTRYATKEDKVRKKTMPVEMSEIYWLARSLKDEFMAARIGFGTYTTIRPVCILQVYFNPISGEPSRVRLQTSKMIIRKGIAEREEVESIVKSYEG